MPKDILPINFFEGGYNSASSPRDIEDNQLVQAVNVDTSIKGGVKCLGEFDTFLNNDTGDNNSATALDNVDCKGGYGLHFFSTENELTTNNQISDPGGYYLAIYKPSAASPRILFYNQPQEDSNVNIINNTIGDITLVSGADGSTSKVQFLNADGGLKIYDSNFQFKPHSLRIIPKGRHLFRNSANNSANDLEFTSDTWKMNFQFVTPPTGGSASLTSVSNLSSSLHVGLFIEASSQQGTSLVPVGWGQDENNPREYYFYASFVYDGRQESVLHQLNSTPIKLGGGGQNGGTAHNDVSFCPYVKPGSNAANWNPRITSIRIYYRDVEYNEETKYFIGDYPTQSTDGTFVSTDLNTNTLAGHVALAGDKNANTSTLLNALGWSTNIGTYHKTPPTVFTHAVMSGLRETTVSTECFYRTGCIINRKLYVGNVKQKTADNPLEEIVYGDRMLKSIANRFDVLPDTEFIDVNIKDGEDIIKLAGFNNRLLQFKERTLYVIVVAGAEEYLEAKYDFMGITHPEACVVTDIGICWVNENGAFIYTGEGRPQNMVSGKIDKDEWSSFVSNNTIVGFDPTTMQLIIIRNCTNIKETGENITGGTDSNDIWIHNLLTGSWNKGMDKLGDGVTGHDNMTNIVNYTDVNGKGHCVNFIQKGNIVEWKSAKAAASGGSYTIKPFDLQTKEFTGGSPHLRKKFYKCYITYKGNMSGYGSSGKPLVYARLMQSSGSIQPVLLEASIDWDDAGADWKVAEFKVPTNQLANARNIYSVSIRIFSDTTSQDFEINDISVVVRAKGVK
tara:strand:+ start:535 stop:2904 length:2370 start_codon:yes stop_codon:yes gene_type:complete